MMKLYYSPGSCALASHIVLEEAGLKFELARVNLKDKRTADGVDYNTINPKGYVPSLQLDDGEILTENTALLPYLGSLNPQLHVMPAVGSIDNYRVSEWLGYIASELHKNFGPLFRPTTPEATVASLHEALGRRLAYIDQALNGKSFLVGENFTVADAYLYVITRWFARVNIEIAAYPNLKSFNARIEARPSVQKALRDEGLLKAA
jgi:glutathione S-transferase